MVRAQSIDKNQDDISLRVDLVSGVGSGNPGHEADQSDQHSYPQTGQASAVHCHGHMVTGREIYWTG